MVFACPHFAKIPWPLNQEKVLDSEIVLAYGKKTIINSLSKNEEDPAILSSCFNKAGEWALLVENPTSQPISYSFLAEVATLTLPWKFLWAYGGGKPWVQRWVQWWRKTLSSIRYRHHLSPSMETSCATLMPPLHLQRSRGNSSVNERILVTFVTSTADPAFNISCVWYYHGHGLSRKSNPSFQHWRRLVAQNPLWFYARSFLGESRPISGERGGLVLDTHVVRYVVLNSFRLCEFVVLKSCWAAIGRSFEAEAFIWAHIEFQGRSAALGSQVHA